MIAVSTTTPRLLRAAPEIPAGNLDAALVYYRDNLGFEVVMTMPERGYAVVERDGVALHLFLDDAHSHSPASFHIFTHGLEELYAELQKRGAQVKQDILRKPWGTRDFRITDPSGNEIKFTEPLEALQ